MSATKEVIVDLVEFERRIIAAEKRVERIEELVADGFTFIADEMRPIFGQQHTAALFQAVADRLNEGKKGDDNAEK